MFVLSAMKFGIFIEGKKNCILESLAVLFQCRAHVMKNSNYSFFFLSLAVDLLLQEIECKMKEGFIKTQIDLAEWSNVIEHGNHEMAGD